MPMDVNISLLGGFSVRVDGVTVPADAWTRRHAASLVKLLAPADGHRLHREQVIDALWPGLSVDAAAPRLHKAAHYARRALGAAVDPRSVVLRNELVVLLPDARVSVDAVEFRARGSAALADGTTAAADAALEAYDGLLLPDDIYEPWTDEPRDVVRVLHVDLLRLASRWHDLIREHPADEQAHLAIVNALADKGDVRAALRQLERFDQASRRELGTAPSPETERLRSLLVSRTSDMKIPKQRAPHRLVGRRDVGDEIRQRLDNADQRRGSTALVTGPPGVGKSAVLDLAASLADKRRWRIGRGTASAVEGPWPYAPVLEAMGDVCRHHPTLLDGLDDNYRHEIERAMSGREVTWSGETAHQRLFVAVAELLRLAAAGHGLLLLVDDLHEADEASLRLLHYLARCAVDEPVLLVLASRSTQPAALQKMVSSLLTRGVGARIDLAPLDDGAVRRLLAHRSASLDELAVEQICAVSGGLPFAVLELAAAAVSGRDQPTGALLPPDVERTLERLALLGGSFSTDELVAVAGVPEAEAYLHLETALAGLVVEPAESGYRFRHALVREGFLNRMPAHSQSAARQDVAAQLAALGAAPGRVAHQYLAAGQPALAVPYALPAVETAGALGAYRDALALVDAVVPHATGTDLAHLHARRGDLLMAMGSPDAVSAYRDAVSVTTGVEHRMVRARLARAACFAGDFATARTALADVDLDGDAADGPILLARGNLAYFTGDVAAAWDAAAQARELMVTDDDPWHFVDLVTLQGLIAHQRGEWFERFRMELRRTQGKTRLATALFDAHLCVAEYLLYGPIPYAEVIELADGLRGRAAHAGALRGVAFATALVGEAALLMGDLPRASRELEEAVDLHRDVDAPAGEAHSLQRLAEVRLAQGDRAAAQQLLQRALPLARWSAISKHLLQRVYGTMIIAASDPVSAVVVVDRAEATMGESDSCVFCAVMLAVPASIACADAGDLDGARRHLAAAERSAARWEGSAWEAAVQEARAHLARAEGDHDEFDRLVGSAATLFTAAGQPLDALRCDTARAPAESFAR